MPILTIFECDGCGDRFGYRNELDEFPLVHEAAHLYDDPEREVVVGCHDCIHEHGLDQRVLYHTSNVEAWGVGRAEDLVTGAVVEFENVAGPQFTQRADLSNEAEAVATFIEEVLL